MATQVERQEIYDAVIEIRYLAKNEELSVCSGLKKNPRWKESLLPLIDRKFVLTQLETLQPYCYLGSNGNSLEFELPYFFYSIYVKVNVKTKQVVSFHYSFDNESSTLVSDNRIKSYREGKDNVIDIITDYSNRKDYIVLNVGYLTIREEVRPVRSSFGTTCMDVNNFVPMMEKVKISMLRKMLREISQEVESSMDWSVVEEIPNYNILSYGFPKDDDNLLKEETAVVSFCLDIYNYDKDLYKWVGDKVKSYLLTADKKSDLVKKIIGHYPGMAGIRSAQLIAETTSEFEDA